MMGTANIRSFVIAVVACTCAVSARAAIYYVGPAGSDSAAGTSLETAWQTLPFAVHQLAGGDTLYVRGGVYRGRVSCSNNNGAAGSPIRIFAYSNEVPVLKGSQIVAGWEPFSGDIWRITNWTHRSQQVFADDVLLQQTGWPNDHLRDYACACSLWLYIPFGYSCADINSSTYLLDMGEPLTNMIPGSFYGCPTSNVLYVRLADGLAPTGCVMEVSTEKGVFYDQSTNGYLHLRGLSFRHSSTMTEVGNGWPGVALLYNGLLEDCDIQWCDGSGLTLWDNSSAVNCRIHNNGIQGILCNNRTNISILGCTILSNNYRAFTYTHAAGIKFYDVRGAVIAGNEVAFNKAVGIWYDTCSSNSGNIISGNYVHDNVLAPNRRGDTFQYPGSGIFVEATGKADVYNNLVVSNGNSGIHLSGASACSVYNNYVGGTHGTPGGHRGLTGIAVKNPQGVGYLVNDNRIFNNIIAENLCDYDLHIVPGNEININRNHSDYNCMYRTTGGGIIFPTSRLALASILLTDNLEAWSSGTGWDTNSMNLPPLFSLATGLATNSPCMDSGISPDALSRHHEFNPGPLDGDGSGVARMDIGPCERMNPSSRIIYADAASTNPVAPFASWITAADSIADAVAVAGDGDLVLVKEGPYTLTDQVTVTNAVTLRSAGCPADTRLISSGSDRCLSVSSPHALIDGLSIEGGAADYGGGVYLAKGVMQNCLVLSNYASVAGGAVYCASGAVIRNTTLMGNASASDGGGIYCSADSMVENCTVIQNGASGAGGGLYLEEGSFVRGSTVQNNMAAAGGGLYLSASATVFRCSVRNNAASGNGGGIFSTNGGIVNFAHIHGNNASNGAGFYSAGNSRFEGCVVVSNTASGTGGGGWLESGGQILYSTVAANAASGSAGGLCLRVGSYAGSCIVYRNQAPVYSNCFNTGGTIEYTCAAPMTAGPGNLDADPLFRDGYRLRYKSPCMDAAKDAGGSGSDIDQNPRFVDGDGDGLLVADMGAYEFRNILYVSASSTNAVVPYRTRATAAKRISDALTTSWHGDVIVVATGMYSITSQLVLNKGVSVFAEGRPDECVVKGNGATRGWLISHPDALVRGFTVTNCAADAGAGIYIKNNGTVQNCHITGNKSTADMGGVFQYYYGTFPVYCSSSYDSYVHEGGGGVLLARGGTAENCLIDNNQAAYAGGALCLDGGTLKNCTISANTASQQGGGVIIQNTGTVRNAIVYFNDAPDGTNVFNTGSSWSYAYSCMSPLMPGEGNIETNPLYVATADFHLQSFSPCLDAGDNDAVLYLRDLDDIPRLLDGNADGFITVDMGAYELAHGTNDADTDGLSDLSELDHGTDIFNRDTDDDGMTDGDEVIAGMNPTDAGSVFAINMQPPAAPDKMLIQWWSATSRTYNLMHATNLFEGFYLLATNLPATPPMNVYTDSITVDTKMYRVGVHE